MLKLIGLLAATVAVLYVGIGVVLLLFQRPLIYMNDASELSPQAAGLPDTQVHRLTTSDGVSIIAWLTARKGDRLAIYFHGNGGSLGWRGDRIAQLASLDLTVLSVDYRGFGGSGGSPSGPGLIADAEAAYAFAQTLGYNPSQIVLYGESLGTGVALGLAARQPVAAVVLDSPFSSIGDVAADRYWMFPVRWLLTEPFRSEETIGRVTSPILMLHGIEDAVVPIRFGRRLAEKAGPSATFIAFPGVGHLALDAPEALDAMRNWLATTLPDRQAIKD
jgi:fermentation-respiration switch protein FrsA (DUF1100 family)